MVRIPHGVAALVLAASLSATACYDGLAGFHGDVEGSTSGSGGEQSGGSEAPDESACDPVVPRSVARLPDRHVANAVATLLSIPRPELSTSPSDPERFVPDQL